MKLLIVAALFVSTAIGPSMAQKPQKQAPKPVAIAEIEIKGLKLGMSFNAVAEAIAKSENGALTIGGVWMKGGSRPLIRYNDSDQMTSLYFQYEPDDFDAVIGAVKSKYPSTICENSKITNRMGAAFLQTECRLLAKSGYLTLSRYGGDITEGSLLLISNDALKSQSEERRKKDGDI